MSKVDNIQGYNNMQYNKIKFEAKPLDVNIAKMQYNLLSRCEQEVPENGDFAPINEKYINLDSRLDLSQIKIICKYDKENPGFKNSNRILSAIISKANTQDTTIELFKGNKKEMLEYLKEKDFFEVCKSNALS